MYKRQVASSGTGCGLIALAVFVLPKDEDEPQQDKRLVEVYKRQIPYCLQYVKCFFDDFEIFFYFFIYV